MRQVTLLGGDGGTGKSLLSLELAVAGVTGTDWLTCEPRRGPALFVSAEDEQDELNRRLEDIVRDRGFSDRDLAWLELVSLVEQAAAGASGTALAVPANDPSGRLHPTPLWGALRAEVERLRPALVVLDTAADLFPEEIKRSAVRGFIAMLRALAVEFDLAVVLLAHPSVSGMESGTGLSGSTSWSNSVRSRLYLDRVKVGGSESDPDARVLRTMKANYGRTGGEIRLRWVDGRFRLETGLTGSNGIGYDAETDAIFLRLLSQFDQQNRDVTSKTCSTYAPKLFAENPDRGGRNKKQFAAAMERLFNAGRIKVEESGPPSRRRSRLVEVGL